MPPADVACDHVPASSRLRFASPREPRPLNTPTANTPERWQAFVVGGAVRDELLGLPVEDHDWVVVGATPDDLLARGFKPVGKDFPVFLHPRTGEEYALARTERKTGPGYTGFAFHAAPDVSLADDLQRRDLTINAMARDEHGTLIDPYGGRDDLAARVFRHVSPAFAEDPVRILRVARFAARFDAFTVAPETLALMQQMVADGEVDHLVCERVWQELARGLMNDTPSRMFGVLRACGALARILPELNRLFDAPRLEHDQAKHHQPGSATGDGVLAVVDHAARTAQPLAVRWACLLHDLGHPDTLHDTTHNTLPGAPRSEAQNAACARAVCDRLKVPHDCRDLALLLAREHEQIHRAAQHPPAAMVTLLERVDAFRRPERFELLVQAAACVFCARHKQPPAPQPPTPQPPTHYAAAALWRTALQAARAIDAGAIAKACSDRARIPEQIRAARVAAVSSVPGER